MKDIKLSFFNSPITNTKSDKVIDLIELYELIKTDYYLKEATEIYRNIPDKETRAEFKKNELPFVTISGVFNERKDIGLLQYSGLIVLDFDDLLETELRKLNDYVRSSPYVVLAFVSISKGMKVVISNPSLDKHKDVYNAARNFFATETDIPVKKIDSSGINLSRACFLCSDDGIYLNPLVIEGRGEEIKTLEPFEKSASSTVDALPFDMASLDAGYSLNFGNRNLELNFRALVSINEKREGKYTSPRQTWLHRLACLCNLFGMDKDRTEELMQKYYQKHPQSVRIDKPMNADQYIGATVADVYKRYLDVFDNWKEEKEVGERENATPCLPCTFFKNLPPFLNQIEKVYKDERERDVVLLATIGVLSSCFPLITGRYDNKMISSNLFFFIGAPAAAGKGSVSVVRLLGRQIQKKLDREYSKKLYDFKDAMEAYKKAKADGGESELPKEPKERFFFVPSNSSSTKMIETLSANENFGVILDTEADTLSQSFKNEWGNYSDVLRKAFHHEPVELQRMKGHLSIERTYLSLVLTGTPDQITNLTNIENGVFSRFAFYDFELPPEWKNVFAVGDETPEMAFSNMSLCLERFVDEMNGREIEFTLTDRQKDAFNAFFEIKKVQMMKIYGNELMSSFHRLGIITFRLAMLFSIIRLIETGHPRMLHNETLICSDLDYGNALEMMELSLVHLIKVYNRVKSKRGKIKIKPKVAFFNNLPDYFDRKIAMEIASLISMNEKTAEYNLSKFIEEGILTREKYNAYKKN